MFLYKTQSLVVFQTLRPCLFFASINLILLYCCKALEHFAKLKALLHFVSEILRSCCLILLCFLERHIFACNNKHSVPDTVVMGQEDRV